MNAFTFVNLSCVNIYLVFISCPIVTNFHLFTQWRGYFLCHSKLSGAKRMKCFVFDVICIFIWSWCVFHHHCYHQCRRRHSIIYCIELKSGAADIYVLSLSLFICLPVCLAVCIVCFVRFNIYLFILVWQHSKHWENLLLVWSPGCNAQFAIYLAHVNEQPQCIH